MQPILKLFFRINKGYGDINQLQLDIMKVVDGWVRKKKTPVPHKYIMAEISNTKHIGDTTIKSAIRVLVQKGYMRKAIVTSNKTFYVQLRGI